MARGINVQKWSSCAYINEIKTIIKVSWTWTDPESWKSIISFPNGTNVQFPVEMTVESEMENGPSSVEKYQYTSYKPFISAKPEVFEVI